MRLFVSILILISATLSFAGTRDPHTPDERYIEFGKSFPWVVQITNSIDCKKCEKVHQQLASAVLIRPNWALTAAHVVKDTTENIIIVGEKKHPIAYKVWHRDFEEAHAGFHDIALCYSPTDFGLKFYTPLYKKSDEVGRAITIAGWGASGTFITGAAFSDNKRRAGHNKIDTEENAVLICRPARPKKFPLEFMIAPGDSGGGMFIGNELAGINSFLAAVDKNANGSYTDESAFTRISLYVDWVEREIAKYENAMRAQATTSAELDLP
jgi:hypothetical protein